MFDLFAAVIIAYLMGSLSGSLILGRLRRVDIRKLGSGNAGGTNALRTQGIWFALGVVVIDVGKAVLAVALLPGWLGADLESARILCAFAAVLGHCYPVWHGFRGGKGAATAVGALAVIQAWLLLPMLSTWVIVLVLSGYVGLATVLAGLSLVPAALIMDSSPRVIALCAVLAVFMAFTHRANLARLKAGTENQFERIMVFRRGKE